MLNPLMKPLLANSLAEVIKNIIGFSPANLFALGEQGWWFDNSDLSTMFQDSAGTTSSTGKRHYPIIL